MREQIFSARGAQRGAAMAAALAMTLALPACNSIKNALGITKHTPDEFAVVTKAPLVVPPDFSLRPPRAGALGPMESTPVDTAQQTVFGVESQKVAPENGQSQGEVALLEHAGAAQADPEVRKVISAENRGAEAKNEGFVDQVMFWQDKTPAPDPTVDAQAEAARIHEAAAKGQSVANAPVAEVRAEKKGLLSRLWPF